MASPSKPPTFNGGDGSSDGLLTGAIVGIAVGGATHILPLGLFLK
jgi:hypothetical protein